MQTEGSEQMDDLDTQEQTPGGFMRTLADNGMQIGVTAAIGVIGFVTTMLVLNNPGVQTVVPALMAASTALFTLIAADVVRRPMRTIVILAGLMLFGYLCAMTLAVPMSNMIGDARMTARVSVDVPPPATAPDDASTNTAAGTGAR